MSESSNPQTAAARPRQAPFRSYVEAILGVLDRSPGRPAVTSPEGVVSTGGEVRDGVYRMAAELAARGVTRGATAVLLVGNRPENLLARYALNLLGARVVHLNEGMSPAAQAGVVDSVDTGLLLADSAAWSTAEELLAHTSVPMVLTFGPVPGKEDLVAAAAARDPHPVAGAAGADDDWTIRHTGGTTGVPKGIRMAHGPYHQALAERAVRHTDGEPLRLLACTTLAHMSGIFADTVLLSGGDVVLRHSFEPADVLATIERERITDLWLLPPLLYELLDCPALPDTDTSSLRRLSYGGTAAAPERLQQAAEALGPVLHGAYGQSEAGWITEMLPHEHTVTGSAGQVTVGRAARGVSIEVRDEAGNPLPAERTGEIHVRSPMVMSGYWKQPELTAEVLQNGWISTGDAGYLDADGYLYIVDRIKDMVVVVGGHVYPADLEALLLSHPAVAQCAVFGVRGADALEEVHTAVVPAQGGRIQPDAIREFVTTHKGAMYAPAAVHVMDRLPLTGPGKPDRRRLRELVGTV